jgi:hypothetical protein
VRVMLNTFIFHRPSAHLTLADDRILCTWFFYKRVTQQIPLCIFITILIVWTYHKICYSSDKLA